MSDYKSYDALPSKNVYQKMANEYVFALAVQKVNEQRLDAHQKPITVSEARNIRRQWINKLREQPATKSYLNTLRAYTAKGKHFDFNDDAVLSFSGPNILASLSSADADVVAQANNRTSEILATLNEVFPEANISEATYKDITTNMFESHRMSNNNGLTDFIPLSPYDETFQDRSAFLRNPSEILYVDKSMFEQVGMWYAQPTGVTSNIYMYRGRAKSWNDMPKRYGSLADGSYPVKNVVPFYDIDDVTGFAAFKPYLSSDEYSNIRNIYVRAHSGTRPTKEQLRQSAELLRLMSEEGYDYSVYCRDSGELIARLNDYGSNVTVVPQAGSNFGFNFGKVMAYNMNYRFSTDERKPANSGGYESQPYQATAKNVMDLIHFTQGIPVEKINQNRLNKERAPMVGQPDVVVSKKSNTNSYVASNTAYYASNSGHATFQYDAANGNLYKAGNITVSPAVAERTQWFGVRATETTEAVSPKDDAINYLQNAVQSARTNYLDALNIEDMIAQAEAHRDDADYVYPYSMDEDIAGIQKKYWYALTTEASDISEISLPVVGTEVSRFDEESDAPQYYQGTIVEQIHQHAADSVDANIGQYEPDANGKRFNPVGVSSFMDTEQSIDYNNNTMIVAMDLAGITSEEMKGSDYYAGVIKNRLLKFDDKTAAVMGSHSSKFIRQMNEEIKNTLQTSGCYVEDKDILIDENGVVQYKVRQAVGKNKTVADAGKASLDTVEMTGYIGQIFAPETEYPGVITKFANGDNYMFVPGYTATILPQKPGENLSLEERTRLDGYEQHMARAIRSHVKKDMLVEFARYEGAPRGETTSLNHVYRQLYDVRHPVDYVEITREEGMDDDLRKAILETEASRVSYGKKFKEGATLNASYQSTKNPYILVDDLNSDALTLTGGRNMAILSEESDGYFDKDATSTGITQGITRYLVQGAKVDMDGHIIPSDNKDDRTALFLHPYMQFSDNVPFDRRQMVFNNLLKAQKVSEPIQMAQMTLGGWNFDDGFVVTDKFARENPVRDHDGNMRPMKVGDKILDFGGNKGVIPLIYDTSMTREEAEEQGLAEVHDFFEANPDVQVVGAPFAAVGRFNASSYLECRQETHDMVNPKTGETLPGSIGTARFIVTHMTVDEKTHIYDEAEFDAGNGRSASAQLGWGLDSKGSVAIKKSFYSDNDRAFQNMREYMIVCGLDMDETGHIKDSYEPHNGESRHIFAMPEPQYKTVVRKNAKAPITSLDIRKSKNDFIKEIGKKGGFLELPFPLKFPEGGGMIPRLVEETEIEVPGEKMIRYNKESWTVTRNGKTFEAHRNKDLLEGSKSKTTVAGEPKVSYGLPVLSSYLRSGQRFEDGTQSVHDYTKQYATIYEHAVRYIDAERKLSSNISDADKEKARQTMETSRSRAQRAFDEITGDIIKHKFDSKYNAFKSEMMTNTLPRSATAVWTADPRLNIEDVAIGADMAKAIGVKEGDGVMVWRDPLLRDAGVRYLHVKVDENLVGVAINPVMDKGYDGDFDGDSVAIVALDTQLADEPTSDEARSKAVSEFIESWHDYIETPALTDTELAEAAQHRYMSYNSDIRRETLTDVANEWRKASANPPLPEAMLEAGRKLRASENKKENIAAANQEAEDNAWARARSYGMSRADFEADWNEKQDYHYAKMAARKDFIKQERANGNTDKNSATVKFEMQWLSQHGSPAMKDIFAKGWQRAEAEGLTLDEYRTNFVHLDRGQLLSDERIARRNEALAKLNTSEGYNGRRTLEPEEFNAMMDERRETARIQALSEGKSVTDFERSWYRNEMNDLRNHARMAAGDRYLDEYRDTENAGRPLSKEQRNELLTSFSNEWREVHTSQFMLDAEQAVRADYLESNPNASEKELRAAWAETDKAELKKTVRDERFKAHMDAYDRDASAQYVKDRMMHKAIRNGKTVEEFEADWADKFDSPDIQNQIQDAFEHRHLRDAKRDSKILAQREIKDEAERLFSVESNLLDYGVKNEDGSFDIMMNHGLDLKMSEYKRPELKDRFEGITADINEFEGQYNRGEISYEEVAKRRKAAVASINDYVHEAFDHNTCEAVVSYESDKAHMASLSAIVESGAKGSFSKLVDYGRYGGMKVGLTEPTDDKPAVLDIEHMVSEPDNKPLAGRTDSLNVEYATAVKASVGIAGKYSQRGMKNCRDSCAKAVLEMTYPATQGLLQAKHDPIDARQKYELLMTSLRDCWRGYEMTPQYADELDQYGQPTGKQCRVWTKQPAVDDSGNQIYQNGKLVYKRATTDVWKKQVVEICTAKDGLNVPINPDYAEDIAKALTDKDGFVRSVEETDAGCLLDRLAYKNAGDSAISILRDAAKNGESIYDGKCASRFMPKGVEHNVRALSVGKEDKVRAMAKSDTKSRDTKPVKVMSTHDYFKYESERQQAIEQAGDAVHIQETSVNPMDYLEDNADVEAVAPTEAVESILEKAAIKAVTPDGKSVSVRLDITPDIVEHPHYIPGKDVIPVSSKEQVEAAKVAKKATVVKQTETKPKKATYNPSAKAAKSNNNGRMPDMPSSSVTDGRGSMGED